MAGQPSRVTLGQMSLRGLTVGRRLPAYPNEETSSEPVVMSQTVISYLPRRVRARAASPAMSVIPSKRKGPSARQAVAAAGA
jgi:hypothetical protein